VRPELAGHREPERVRAPAGDVALLMGKAIARAHDAARFLATGAVVVAHLDRALETAAGTGIGRPIERCAQPLAPIAGRIAEQRAVVEFRRAQDLAGLEEAGGIEETLPRLEGAHEPASEHRLVKLGAQDAVAVLAGMRALVFTHHGERLFGDRAHRLDVLVEAQIQYRPHVQAADPAVRLPR